MEYYKERDSESTVCTSEQVPPIFINYDTVVNQDKAAEAFNIFFNYNSYSRSTER
jgi:hypothetical protein